MPENGKLKTLLGKTGRLMPGAILAILLVACGGTTSPDLTIDLSADFPITVYTGTEVLGGAEIDFSDLRGRPVVLNFWAGLCPPCRAEMPDLQQFYDEYQDRIGMIGVDVGQFTGLGNPNDARTLLDELKITYPTGFTTQGAIIQEYGVLTMPTTVFITGEGQVFRKWSGVLDRGKLAEITDQMLSLEPG
jgi:thiol-disulfide isomerase/thioredoxin